MRLLLAICWKSSRLMRCLLIRQGNDAGGGYGDYDGNAVLFLLVLVLLKSEIRS